MPLRTRIGRIEVVAICDFLPPPAPPDQSFPDVPLEAWEPYRESSLRPDGQLPRNYGVFILRSDDFIAIVDTGLGPGPHQAQNGMEGQLLANLAAEGVRPEDTTAVLNTHLHPDHVGWNLTDGRATFPNARYCVSRVDWGYWTGGGEIAPHVRESAVPLEALNVLELVDDGDEMLPGVRALATPGHTPGHQSILIESDGDRAIVTGDLLHTAAQLQETDWAFRADVDKPLASATRRALIERAVREKLTLAVGHMPIDTNIGQVIEVEGRRYWQVV